MFRTQKLSMYTRCSFSFLPLLACLSMSSVACKSRTSAAPTLPNAGSYDDDSKKKAPPLAASKDSDPWSGKTLIVPPKAQSVEDLQLPDVQRFSLKNGLEVIAVHDQSIPVLSMQVVVKAGKRDAQIPGLAQFTASAIARGSRSMSASAIAQAIESVGGSLQASASHEATLFGCNTMSEDSGTCLKVIPEILARPSFVQTETELIRRNLLAEVRGRLDNAGQLASAHLRSFLWGDTHPRGKVMSAESIRAIGKKDLQAFHKDWIRPENSILTIAGNFDRKTLKAKLDKSFAKWRKGKWLKRTTSVHRLPKTRRIRLVDKPGQSQSHIRIGQLGLSRTDPRFFPALVFNHALGGGQFSSRMMKKLRSLEGKTYSAGTHFDRNSDQGAFISSTFTKNSEVASTIALMDEILLKMKSEGPTDAEREAAIANLAGSYAMGIDNASKVASALVANALVGYRDEKSVSEYPSKLASVSLDEARKAAHEILDPKNSAIVVVGDAKEVAPLLRKAGYEFETVPFTAPITGPQANRAENPKEESPQSEAEKSAQAKKIVADALKAKGGVTKLQALKGYFWKGQARLATPNGETLAQVDKKFSDPSKLRLDMNIAGQVQITTVLSGTQGWAREKSPRGEKVHPFGAMEVEAVSTQLWRDSELVLLRSLESGVLLTMQPSRKLDGRTIHAIEMAKGKRKVTLLIDADSKMLVGMEYADQGIGIREAFGKYKKIGGIAVAHERSTLGSQVNMKIVLQQFSLNPSLPSSTFSLPKTSKQP